MHQIKLLYAENVITRKKGPARQRLVFFVLLENLGYDKQVDVLWAGENGEWRALAANFHSALGPHQEYWRAEIQFALTAAQSLPGNIKFALRYRVAGAEYWDNNDGINYASEADSGILLAQDLPLLNVEYASCLESGQTFVPVTVAVDQSLQAENVTVHWSTDHWQHTHLAPCRYKRKFWDAEWHSNARNPNRYGYQLWRGWLRTGNAFRVQYSVACESKGRVLWDNNQGQNYTLAHAPLKILILNLHCYQEEQQDYKFSQIARAINDHDIDIVCLQEVAENWNDGAGDWESNAAKIILERLAQPYHIHTDWSHLGFDRYREGVAILSKYPLVKHDARYVSASDDPYNIHARKVVMAQVKIPHIGSLNVYSAHLSWWEDGFQEQFNNLHAWARSKHNAQVQATLLCGDFNVVAGSAGYSLVVDSHEYEDQFLAATSQAVFEKIFRVNDPYWRDYLADDYRIDYVFMNKASALQAISGQVLFTDRDYGRVSDHCGYLMAFEPR